VGPHGLRALLNCGKPNALGHGLVSRESRVGSVNPAALAVASRSERSESSRWSVAERQTVRREVRRRNRVEAFETGGSGFPRSPVADISRLDCQVSGDLPLEVHAEGVDSAGRLELDPYSNWANPPAGVGRTPDRGSPYAGGGIVLQAAAERAREGRTCRK